MNEWIFIYLKQKLHKLKWIYFYFVGDRNLYIRSCEVGENLSYQFKDTPIKNIPTGCYNKSSFVAMEKDYEFHSLCICDTHLCNGQFFDSDLQQIKNNTERHLPAKEEKGRKWFYHLDLFNYFRKIQHWQSWLDVIMRSIKYLAMIHIQRSICICVCVCVSVSYFNDYISMWIYIL